MEWQVKIEIFKVIWYVSFQFPDVVSFSDEMAEMGKTVIVAALDGTFQKKVCFNKLPKYHFISTYSEFTIVV